MPTFSALILTALPPGLAADSAGGHLTKVDQREVLLRSVELFLNRDEVKQVQVVFLPDAFEEAKRKFGPHLSFTGVKVLSAGPRWIDQLAAAKDKIDPQATHVVIHDAARPCVPYGDIDALLEAAGKHPAVVLTAPLRASLVETDPAGFPVAIQAASAYFSLLTPQVYSKDKFAEICSSHSEPHASQLHLVKGSSLNIRIAPGETGLCKSTLALLPKPKSKPLSSPFEEAQW